MPAFNYMVLTNDHTEGLKAGARTPTAMIADNDEAVGRIVDLISHSTIWESSAIFVIEDDSQDGADHVDAHRIPALVISPYAKRGAVVHTRYDLLSVIRSIELILGMGPLGLFDALAVADVRRVRRHARERRAVRPHPGQGAAGRVQPGRHARGPRVARLPKCLDCIPQADIDALLWKSVHGWNVHAAAARPQRRGRPR